MRVAQHRRDHVPAVPDELHDAGVGEGVDHRVGAVHQVRGSVAVAVDVALPHAAPGPVDPARLPAVGRAVQAAVRGDLPGLGERVPQHGGRRLVPAALDRGAAGERVDHAEHAALADRHMKSGRLLQRPGHEVRARVRGADDEHGLADLAAVDDQDVGRAGMATRSRRQAGPRHPAVVPRVAVQVQRGLDQRHVAEGLRGVADLALIPRVVFLAEQPDVVAQGQQPLEQAPPRHRSRRSGAAR